MKVTSDACIFGAWVNPPDRGTILDIGTGTGLLALMMAQRTGARIDAVEIESGAAADALENFRISSWCSRISFYHTSVQEFAAQRQPDDIGYTAIICNPPFYSQAPKSSSRTKRMAWHDEHLDIEALISVSAALLQESGTLFLLQPAQHEELVRRLAVSSGFGVLRCCRLKSFPDRHPHRLMIALTKGNGQPTETAELVVYRQPGVYTPECVTLLKPFCYL